MKKGWLIGCGAGILSAGLLAGLGVLIVGGTFALTRPVVDASEQFLDLLGQGRVAEAYASAADGLRSQHDEALFSGAVRQLGLTDYTSVSWHSRQIENQEGIAEGTVTTRSGDTRSVSVRLVRERDRWAVVGVRYGGVELASVQSPPPVPSEAESERMAAETLLGFNRAVRDQDFTALYSTLSEVWKKETTPKQLQATFQEFLDKEIDIAPIKDVKPRLAPPPAVNDKGVLVIAGRYPTQSPQVGFELKYARERGGWKLMAISVSVGEGAAE
ncbi:MAG TPA: hypothetical protein VM533_02455 [Fimbriiglobus sp.]|jgi:hypothetical protein|nr:hypothetical protein [Fimbriiglobus sp.]